MDVNIVKLVGTLVAAALAVLGHVGVIPVDTEISTSIAALIAGWLHLPQPKKS